MVTETKQAEIMFCQSCGNKLNEESAFCPKCGKEIPRQAQVQNEAPPNQNMANMQNPQNVPQNPNVTYNPNIQNIPNNPNVAYNPNNPNIAHTPNYSNVMYANTGQTSNAPARKMLKIVGIIGIIVSSIDFLVGIFGLLIGMALGTEYAEEFAGFVTTGMIVSTIVIALFAIYSIFTSIYAVLNCNKLNKAGALQILGIIRLGTVGVAAVIMIVMYGLVGVVMLPLGFILPIFYVIGASKNKAAFVGQNNYQGQNRY